MIPPLGRGHRGGALSISSRDSSSRGRSGAHIRRTRVGACCGGRGAGFYGAMSAAEEPTAAREGSAAARKGPTAGDEGTWSTHDLKE